MATKDWNIDCKVYVGEIGYGAAKQELEDVFSKYGALRNVWVARNPPGFAFVEFEDPRDAQDACDNMDGQRINGRRARVEMSSGKSRWGSRGPPSRWSGGGGGGGGSRGRDSFGRDSNRDRQRRRSRSRSPYRRRSPSPYRRRSPSPRRRYSRSRSPRDTSRDRSPVNGSRSPDVKDRSPHRDRSPYDEGDDRK